MADEYLAQGYQVYASARKLESLDKWHADNLHKLALDVNNDQSIRQAMQQIKQEQGKLDCLVNNAGYAAMGALLDISKKQLLDQFETNVFAPIHMTQAAADLLIEAGKKEPAQVINIGSVSGITPTPFSGAYCASKSALHSLNDALRMELAPFNIQVICIQPGAIESSFGTNSSANLQDPVSQNSRYSPIKAAIQARATASQDNPTSAKDFAREVIHKLHNKPATTLRAGNGSTALPLLKHLLPSRWLDKILSKKFKLDQLG